MDTDEEPTGGCCGLKWLRNAISKRFARLSDFFRRRRRRVLHPADVTAHKDAPNDGDEISITSSVISAIAECAVRESLLNLASDGERAPADPSDTAGGELASCSQLIVNPAPTGFKPCLPLKEKQQHFRQEKYQKKL